MGSLIAAIVFVPIGMAQATDLSGNGPSAHRAGGRDSLYRTPYSLEMIALTRLPTRTFGTLMSMEPALAAISGMVFLGETLTLTQTLALCSIIAASMGSTLTMRPEPKVEKVDIN
jgi:inner membrane transporter RhtA